MFIKTRTVIVLAALLIVLVGAAMAAEWKFVAFVAEGSAIHNYHGICNGGVGRPYQDFIHELRTIAESGDTNRLVTVLRRADERSRDIYDVWLGYRGIDRDAYLKSIEQILK